MKKQNDPQSPFVGLTRLSKQISTANQAKGFKPASKKNIDQKLLLSVGEICEAQEALRDGEWNEYTDVDKEGRDKPEGFPVEIADAIIRLLDIAGGFEWDIGGIVARKLEYNASRKPKHGRRF